MMDRCALAYQYHKEGWNCAQAVAGSCAVSGGVLILSLCFPHARGGDQAAKQNLYRLSREFRRRFFETFGYTRCGELLRARPGVTEKTPAARRLGAAAHCDIMIVTAVELLEALVAEERGRL